MAKWLPPHGFTGKVHALDGRVGGRFRMSFTNFTTGDTHAFGGEYLELVPNERLRYTDVFEDPDLPGAMEAAVELQAGPCGTEIRIQQARIPAAIPLDGCTLGWQESLAQFAWLVEAEIRLP